MKSKNKALAGHVQYSSPWDVQHTGPSDMPEVVENSFGFGLFSQDDTCTPAGGVTLSECRGQDCKRKSMDSTAVCDMGPQKRMRCHMSLEVTPSGLLCIVCIPVTV